MRPDLLHVVTAYFNPIRWKSRLALHLEFEQRMLQQGVKLTVVEMQLGERPFQLSTPGVNYVQVRTQSLLFNKENLQGIGVADISRTAPDWKYLACIDGDILFRNAGWATETVQALQQYRVIQPWATCYDLGPHGEHLHAWSSFCSQWHQKKPMRATASKDYTYCHTGYAWAYTRQAFDWLGGLLETAALGAGDHHMAWSLIGHADWTIPTGVTPEYRAPIMQWQDRATQHIHQNIGYLSDSTIEHFWHGSKDNRQYKQRWSIIVDNKFDPVTDLKKNSYGVLELSGNKPELAHDLDLYFRQRNEDGNVI